MEVARKHGTIVSYDLNYRESLWKSIGGQARAVAVNRELAPLVSLEDFFLWHQVMSYALNLDGGGSTTMWLKKRRPGYCQSVPAAGGCLVNRPSPSTGGRVKSGEWKTSMGPVSQLAGRGTRARCQRRASQISWKGKRTARKLAGAEE